MDDVFQTESGKLKSTDIVVMNVDTLVEYDTSGVQPKELFSWKLNHYQVRNPFCKTSLEIFH